MKRNLDVLDLATLERASGGCQLMPVNTPAAYRSALGSQVADFMATAMPMEAGPEFASVLAEPVVTQAIDEMWCGPVEWNNPGNDAFPEQLSAVAEAVPTIERPATTAFDLAAVPEVRDHREPTLDAPQTSARDYRIMI